MRESRRTRANSERKRPSMMEGERGITRLLSVEGDEWGTEDLFELVMLGNDEK